MGEDGSQKFTATVNPLDASIQSVTFNITPATAGLTVDETGLAEWDDKVPADTYTITVTTVDGKKTATATLELGT